MPDEFPLLDPDLIAEPGGFWRVRVFRETESTNDIAQQAAEGGEPEGFVVFAEAQTRGRGQFGRRWDSAPGLGLWCSLLLRPSWGPAQFSQITPLVAVATARAVARHAGLPINIKPPNDVFCRGRKLAGILSETRTGRHPFVVVGVGINVNHAAHDFPPELRATATSVAIEAGSPTSREALASLLLGEIAGAYDPEAPPGPAILDEYAALSRAPVCDSFPP
jgi:BirA family biotin operon repressor/biotin-[acetyl-CoA-carboxylase] ligase